MKRINKGTIAVMRDGEIVNFENGNDGENGEYRKFMATTEGKRKTRFLFADPSVFNDNLCEGAEDSDRIRELKFYIDDQYGDDIEKIRKIINKKYKRKN